MPGHGPVAASMEAQTYMLAQGGVSSHVLLLVVACKIAKLVDQNSTATKRIIRIVVPHIAHAQDEEIVMQAFQWAFPNDVVTIVPAGRAELAAINAVHNIDGFDTISIVTVTPTCESLPSA